MNPIQMMSGMLGGNNPMMALMNAARSGGNPMQQMARQDPQIRNMMKLIEGKSPQQLRQTAENMAKQRGTSVEEIARQLGIPMK